VLCFCDAGRLSGPGASRGRIESLQHNPAVTFKIVSRCKVRGSGAAYHGSGLSGGTGSADGVN
jgi:hypothetical protein